MADNLYVRSVEFVKSAVYPQDFPELDQPEIAIAGRSNVGKSSLINKLVNRRSLARVSNTPGRTQLLNFFTVNDTFTICDLPGYGYAKAPQSVRRQWGPMVERYLIEREELRALLLLVDARREPGEWEAQVMGWCSAQGLTVIPVVTKIDKFSKSKRKVTVDQVARKMGFSARQVVGWSSVSGEGLDSLWRAIQRQFPAEESVDEPSE
jgi:GTP-binding protein